MDRHAHNKNSTKTLRHIKLEDSIILDSNFKTLFITLKSEVKKYFSLKREYVISFKLNKISKKIIVIIRLPKNTAVNAYDTAIFFYITIDERYPEVPPNVTCHSNFTYPSLYDNRNLVKSLMNFSWRRDTKIATVIENLPKFVAKYSSDLRNTILTNYGEYRLNDVYDVNDFLLNSNNVLFKVTVERGKTCGEVEIRYLIATDVYILVFIPCDEDKSKGMLCYMEEIRKVSKLEAVEVEKKNGEGLCSQDKSIRVGVAFTWEESVEYKYETVIYMTLGQMTYFIDIILKRKSFLIGNFVLFQEDSFKSSISKYVKVSDENALNLVKLIEQRESMIENNENITEQMIQDLVFLYQKVIEIYSGKSCDICSMYVGKLQTMLERHNMRNSSKANEESEF